MKVKNKICELNEELKLLDSHIEAAASRKSDLIKSVDKLSDRCANVTGAINNIEKELEKLKLLKEYQQSNR